MGMAFVGVWAACLSAPDRCKRRLPSLRSETLEDAKTNSHGNKKALPSIKRPTGANICNRAEPPNEAAGLKSANPQRHGPRQALDVEVIVEDGL